jgi:hypothetical protein
MPRTPRSTRMSKFAPTSKRYYVAAVLLLLFVTALAVIAQSGRRVRKPQTPSPPVVVEEATPLPTPLVKPTPAYNFVVGMEVFGDFTRVSLYTMNGILRSCADRFNDAPAARGTVSGQSMSRADAIRQAKAEKTSYIVWFQLRSNSKRGQAGVYDDPNDVYLQYAVLAPQTAKQMAQGNTYPEAYRNKRIRLPTPTNSGDYYLNQAARGAAERILDHFHLIVHRVAANR